MREGESWACTTGGDGLNGECWRRSRERRRWVGMRPTTATGSTTRRGGGSQAQKARQWLRRRGHVWRGRVTRPWCCRRLLVAAGSCERWRRWAHTADDGRGVDVSATGSTRCRQGGSSEERQWRRCGDKTHGGDGWCATVLEVVGGGLL